MKHEEYLDAILRASDQTAAAAIRQVYYNDLIDILQRCEQDCFSIDVGWFPLVAQTHRKLKYLDPNYKIYQIKQKFAGLRYYYAISESDHSDFITISGIMQDVVSVAENKSFTICEVCSKPGSRSNKYTWIRTVCQDHDTK
jgi:hypothetical protein